MKYYSKFNTKDKVMKKELVRAHSMILLLVIALMTTLTISSTLDIVLDPVLTFIAVFLLAIVGIISLTIILSLLTKRK